MNMKYLLLAVAVATATIIATRMLADNNPDSFNDYILDNTDDSRYYGDTIYSYDGKTVLCDWTSEDNPEISSLQTPLIITYSGKTPVDTCRISGCASFRADDSLLKCSVGVDTVAYDFRQLPSNINPTERLLPPGTLRHNYHRSFSLNDSSWICDFKFTAYLPDSHPIWLRQFIAVVMRKDIQGMYIDTDNADRMMKEYYSIKSTPGETGGINASATPPEHIAAHISQEFEDLYRKEFSKEDFSPKYDYMMEISPAWQSQDGKLVTYRFYTYYYTMGAHGYMEEYYITFDNTTGRIMGYEDLFGAKDFKKAIELLEQKITAQKKALLDFEALYPASIDNDEWGGNISLLLKEMYNGDYYPRPALTGQGVVFSYQPYEKGSFAEGILHFVIPYPSLNVKVSV